MIGAACFATLSLLIAALVKTRERFMGIGQVLTMPLFFASNAIYPLAIMPPWLHVIARINPLSYEVDAVGNGVRPRADRHARVSARRHLTAGPAWRLTPPRA